MRQAMTALALAVSAALTISCGSSTGQDQNSASAGSGDGGTGPIVVVTTDVWADIVTNLTCGEVQISTLIPPGADPHSFESSLADRATIADADLVVANGLGLEAGIDDVIDSAAADGTPVILAAEPVDTIVGADGIDPHVWFDPTLVASATPELVERLVADVGLEREAVEACADAYRAELDALDSELAATANVLPVEDRKLVTEHDSLGYLADRYGFEVVGTVIPGTSGLAETSPAHLEDLADLLEEEQVNAIFVEAHHSADEADALASTVDGVQVVSLGTGSLGTSGSDTDSYVGWLRATMTTIVDALA